MAYLEELLQQQQYNPQTYQSVGLPKGQAYASFYNPYEVSSPQYTVPNAFQVAQMGYRTNEFVYSIIGKRAKAIAQAPLWVFDDTGETPEEQPKHEILKLLKACNQNIPERMFWQITQIYMDIAGFCAWEIEKNMLGDPIKLWPMRPDWCSFMRGQQEPMRAIRYQPYGLPFQDIPIYDTDGTVHVLFFSNGEDFDPIYPGIRFFSPTMHALSQISVDNAMTRFLTDFVVHGAKFAGLLSVAQTIDQTTADDFKKRWRQAHGGVDNWTDPLILGQGTTYSSMQMNFKDMAFGELDARTEARICNTFDISTIVADARAGLDVATFNNKEQAHKSWHYEWVLPQWQDLADAFGNQMLPMYETNPVDFFCEFHTDDVYALVEDRTAQVTRSTLMYEKRVAKLDEAREEMGLDPIKGKEGDSFYVAATIRDQQLLTAQGDVTGTPEAQPGQKPVTPADKLAQEAEAKKFRTFARKRIKEGKPEDIKEYEWKVMPIDKQAELIAEFVAEKSELLVFAEALNKLAEKV